MSSFTFGEEMCVKYTALGCGVPGVPFLGADTPAPYTVEGWERYSRISRRAEVQSIGRKEPFGKPFYLNDALKAIWTKGWVPTNTLESIKIAASQFGNVGGLTTHEYWAKRIVASFLPWDIYMNSLNSEYDPEKFLNLLLLHESAGLYAGRYMRDITLDMTAILTDPMADPVLPRERLTTDLLGYKGTHWVTFGPVRDPLWWWDYNPLTDDNYDHLRTKDEKLDAGTIYQYQYPEFLGAQDHARLTSFLLTISRFRERVLAKVLGQTFFMLDVAKLTDENTVKTMYQVFMNDPGAIYGKIAKTLYRDVTTTGDLRTARPEFQDWMKAQIGTVNDSINWGQFSGVKLRFKGRSGKTHLLTIDNYLRAQFEAVIWLLICNLNKLEGRIAQLETNTAQLMAQAPIPWVLDPWENPFLLYDQEMSDRLNKAMYKNVATSAAQQPPQLLQAIESVAVPQQFMKQAPAIRAKYARLTTLPGGAAVSLDELTGRDQGFTPAILAAVAAAAIGYLATR